MLTVVVVIWLQLSDG